MSQNRETMRLRIGMAPSIKKISSRKISTAVAAAALIGVIAFALFLEAQIPSDQRLRTFQNLFVSP